MTSFRRELLPYLPRHVQPMERHPDLGTAASPPLALGVGDRSPERHASPAALTPTAVRISTGVTAGVVGAGGRTSTGSRGSSSASLLEPRAEGSTASPAGREGWDAAKAKASQVRPGAHRPSFL